MESSRFLTLPVELQLQIFNSLPFVPALALKLTCHYCYDTFKFAVSCQPNDKPPENVLELENWQLFASADYLGCLYCERLYHFSKFRAQETIEEQADQADQADPGHGKWSTFGRLCVGCDILAITERLRTWMVYADCVGLI